MAAVRDGLARPCGLNPCYAFLTDSRIGFCSNQCVTGIKEPDMLTGMTERDWSIVLEVFDAAQSSRGEPGHDDRKFLEALHYFTVHSITWRALPSEFGKWNSVWKRFWRLSQSGVFEAFFQLLAECSQTAHVIQFFDSTTARAHVSAAGAKGGSKTRRLVARAADSRPKSTSRPISTATLSTSI
jgi:transposase